jgi:beta-glucosidase
LEKTQAKPLYLEASRPIPARLKDLLGRMTVDEKLIQLTSYWFHDLQSGQDLSRDRMQVLLGKGIGQISRIGGSSALLPPAVARAGNTIQRFLREHTRLAIPAIFHEECCAGYMGLGGSIFPQMIGMASTWNPELLQRTAAEIRTQMLAVGARQGLAPVLDVALDPRWGRTEETFGEDPLLIARMGAAYIRGVQGDDMKNGLMATAKHFIGYSLSSGGMNCAPIQAGPRFLHETCLMPFQAAVAEAGIRSVMNAYNELDGEVVAASGAILTDLLRGELGFKGVVVSDYSAIAMIANYHHAAADERAAAVKAFKAGIEIELPSRACFGEPLRAALDAGEIGIAEIDAAVQLVLESKFELGLFENPYADEQTAAVSFETPAQRALAREAAGQSLILLKNDGILPLGSPRTIAVIGPNADAPRNMMGDYSYIAGVELAAHPPAPELGIPTPAGLDWDYIQQHSVKAPSILEGIRARAGKGTQVLHAAGCAVLGSDRSGITEAAGLAAKADAVILVLGDKSGFTLDCTTGETRDRAELGLPGVQEELAEAVVNAGKPTAVVLINGRPVSIPWLEKHAQAILEAWLPGEEGAAAVADALFGVINPGGKLPISVPRSVGQVPIQYNHKPSGGRSNWYIDYLESPAGPLYPFGHGLSYTTFGYTDFFITPAQSVSGGVVEVGLTVVNIGKVAGDEVVQLYICDPVASVPRPVKELKGFCRVGLKPGESRKVVFRLPVDILAFYDENMDLVTEAGTIQVMLGGSSNDIRLQGQFEIIGSRKSKVGKRVTVCPAEILTP